MEIAQAIVAAWWTWRPETSFTTAFAIARAYVRRGTRTPGWDAIATAAQAVDMTPRQAAIVRATFGTILVLCLAGAATQAPAVFVFAAIALVQTGGILFALGRAKVPVAQRAVPWIVVGILVVESGSAAAVGTVASVAVAVAVLASAAFMVAIAPAAGALGSNASLESLLDGHRRMQQIVFIAVTAQGPSLVWRTAFANDGWFVVGAQLVCSVGFFAVLVFQAVALTRVNTRLQRIASST
jgi:hypothetical protein